MPNTFTPFLKKFSVAFSLLVFVVSAALSQTLKGKVTDAVTGEAMVGATVKLMETSAKHFVQLDGTFTIKNIKPGTYRLQFSYLSYSTVTKQVTVNASGPNSVVVKMEPNTSELSTVVIGMTGNSSDRKALDAEKNADAQLNVLSAKTIQLSSDLTVASLMQRVSGVTIERSSSGEGRYPIIRGMEKRYVNTLVNGIKIPSPDNKNRYVPLDLFPSELLERLEVSKTLTPSMEGDAIGGTINLVMKDAPSKLILEGSYAAGYNNIFENQSYKQFSSSQISKYSPAELHGPDYAAQPTDFPRELLNYTTKDRPVNMTAALTIGNRFGKSKKFGFIVSGSYQNNYRGTSSTFFLPNAQPGLNNVPVFQELQQRQYSSQSKRLGINTKLDYQINPKNKISLYNLYVKLDDIQERNIIDTIVLNSIVNYEDRSTVQHQSISNTTLQGNHDLNNGLKLDWSLVYSIATNRTPDQAKFSHQYGFQVNSQTGLLERTPDALQAMNRLWMANSDKDYSAYINLTQQGILFNRKVELKAGAVFRDKKRTNIYDEYSFKPIPGPQNATYTNINNGAYTIENNGLSLNSGNNYTFKEDLTEAYAQLKWQLLNNLEILGGVRIEQTHQHYDTELGPATQYRYGTIDYTDVLPALQFKYALTEIQNLRLAYYKALTRPSFIDLIPDGPQGEIFKESGNPSGLNHTTADNLDFRYELFPGASDEILVGAFYKKLTDPIEYTAVKSGVTSQTLIPKSFGNATNYGFEAVVTKYFGPFGVSANYTYTKSSITTDKLLVYPNTDGSPLTKSISETRPLQGQSDHVGNLSLLYKNPKIGLDLQLAGVYTGARISLVSPYYGLDYWQAPTTQLDFSFEKSLIRKLSLYGKVNNITNTPFQLELHKSYAEYISNANNKALGLQSDPDKLIVQKDEFKTSFLLGVRYKL